MTTQKLGEVVNLFGKPSQTTGSNVSKDVFGSGDFGSYLNNNLKSQQTVRPIQAEVSKQLGKSEERQMNPKITYAKDQNVMKDKPPVKTDKPHEIKTDREHSEQSKIKENNSQETKAVQKEESKSEPKDISSKVEKLSEQIETIVKDALGITQEELEGLMGFLGMQMTDLLNLDNLKLLALTANGETDFTAFLTNEGLNADLNSLLQGINQINLEEFGLTEADLASFMELQQKSEGSLLMEDTQVSDDAEQKSENTVILPMDNKSVTEAAVGIIGEDTVTDAQGKDTVASQDSDESGIKLQVETTDQTRSETGKGNENKGNPNQVPVNPMNGLEQLIGNIAGNSGKGMDNFVDQLSAARQMRAIVNQIVDEIKVSVKPTATSMELQLNPASLGKVNLSVVAKDGVLTAEFLVQNAAAKEAIESQLQSLKDNLSNQGVKVEAVEVTVSNFSFDGSNQADGNAKEQKQSHRKLNLDDMNTLEGLTDEEEIISDMMQMNGNTVDYTA